MSITDFPDLPDFLRRPRGETKAQVREAWKDHPLVRRVKIFKESKVITDPGTLKLLADIKAREKAEETERAKAREDARIIGRKKRTRTLALKRALAETNAKLQQPSTNGDDTMAKKTAKKKAKVGKRKAPKAKAARTEKQVQPRFKAGTPKKAEPLKKPRPERAPRGPSKTTLRAQAATRADKERGVGAFAPDFNPDKAAQAAPKPTKAESKGAKLEAMLRKSPVSVAEIAEQLGWLPHTTRAAISRVGFEVTTEKKDKVTLYHIKADAPAKEKADAA